MSEQADQTPGEREQKDPWAPPADRTGPDADRPGELGGHAAGASPDAQPGAGTPDAQPGAGTSPEAETVGVGTPSEAETVGATPPPPGPHDGGTLLDATAGDAGTPPRPEVSLNKETSPAQAAAPRPAAPQPPVPERDIWAPPPHGAPANPWQSPGGAAGPAPYAGGGQAPYAGGGPVPEGAVPPPPVGPEGPGPGYGYPGYGPQPGTPYYGPQQPYGAGPGYGWPHMPMQPSNGMGTASLVLGIIATVLFCLWPVAIIVGILAIIFGAIGRGKARKGEANNGGQALAGLICGCVGTALAVVFLVVVVINNNDPYDNDPYDFGDANIHAAAPLGIRTG
ncbi:DUF4190 domain-containing protein [Streptomyces sp. TRM66268-LWL]|uniref:DUF4190 domain-containing protein n=1 Tax=Streptomyces polyasparticus TaxID=2767826 RepID=A0ABR7SA10_9ACTN|nr:DUF4190 domain-containing protein [Streptomyces polyasparticus]MBC9711714.1 DUF4190 domain-containing protein [Streptomyces polyasparticus]